MSFQVVAPVRMDLIITHNAERGLAHLLRFDDELRLPVISSVDPETDILFTAVLDEFNEMLKVPDLHAVDASDKHAVIAEIPFYAVIGEDPHQRHVLFAGERLRSQSVQIKSRLHLQQEVIRNRREGEAADDADDVVQSVFTDLARKLPTFEYDRTKGRFRSYLLELINWRVIDKVKSGKREIELMTAYSRETKNSPPSETPASTVELEWQSQALNIALHRLKNEVSAEHFTAFVESTIEGVDTETVMKLHGISRDNLYQIRKRLTEKLKPLVNAVLKEMDEGTPPH